MNFTRLNTFIIVAERENITKAASELYLTQQAISKQLLQLEDELQLKLFNRANNTIHLTRDGQTLLNDLRPMFDTIKESVGNLQGRISDLNGVIRVGCAYSVMNENLLQIIKGFKLKYPKVRFEFTFNTDFEIEDQMMANEIDIGLLVVYRNEKIFRSDYLETREYAPCCTKSFYKKYGPFSDYQRILNVPFAEFTHHFASFGRWIKLNCSTLSNNFTEQSPDFIVYDTRTLERFVMDGLCMGFMDLTDSDRLATLPDIVELFPDAHRVSIDLSYVTKKKETERLIEREFRTFVKSAWTNTH